MSYEIRLIGGGEIGRRITDRLEYRGDTVVVIEADADRARNLESAGYRVIHGDGTDVSTLEEAGVDEADVVVVTTGDDDSNLLAAQLVRNHFSPESVVVRINDPANEEPFQELGIATVSHSNAIARMMDLHIESPGMTRWMESLGDKGDVQEIAVQNNALTGLTIRELDDKLPEQVLLVMVGGEGTAHLPDDNEVVDPGDHVTVLGKRSAVHRTMERLSGVESTPEPTVDEKPRRRQ